MLTDKELIMSPINWLRWPVLPMKRPDKENKFGIQIGVMRAMSGEIGTTIYLMGMYSIKEYTDWKKVPKVVYKDVDELLANGWIVD